MKTHTSIFMLMAALFVAGCRSSPPLSNPPKATQQSDWPRTVDAAVTRILATMNDADKERIRATKKEDLIQYHHGWGTVIRNDFGLWGGNKELMADCHAVHPDDASMVIIQAVWQRLQTP